MPAGSQLWRIHIRPSGGLGDTAFSYALCLREGVIGVGWQVEYDGDRPLDPETYLRLGEVTHGSVWGSGRSAVGRLLAMEVGDFVWMRSPQGVYHLCRVTGPWEYRGTAEHRDADIANIRPVEIIEVGVEDAVPGKVVACFRPRRTVQRIRDETAADYSRWLWAKHTGGDTAPSRLQRDVFSMLSSDDLENILFVYAQVQGWVVYPATRKSNTLAYEFVLRHRDDGRKAVVQVKAGHAQVDLGSLPDGVDTVFAFQPNGHYTGTNPKARLLSREEILEFLRNNRTLLPDAVTHWLDACETPAITMAAAVGKLETLR